MLSARRLRKVLSYAPTTGIFRWKVSASSRAPVGAIAGAKNGRGYHQIRISCRPYSASRLAWLYMTGKWPNSEISYINGKPSDTRWANLREATSSQNRSRPKRNSKAFAAGGSENHVRFTPKSGRGSARCYGARTYNCLMVRWPDTRGVTVQPFHASAAETGSG